MQKDDPKKHHYVPVFYLKKWSRADRDGTLIEYQRVHGGKLVEKECGPRATGFERYLYSRSVDDQGTWDHTLESQYLKELDFRASHVLEQLLDAPRAVSAEQKMQWAKFILVLMMRSPEEMEFNQEFFTLSWDNAAQEHEDWYQEARDQNDPATFLDYLGEMSEFDLEEARYGGLKDFFERTRITALFYSLRWSVRQLNNAKFPLLLSDRPVFCNNRFAFNDGLIFMPLSPSAILFAEHQNAPPHPILEKGSENAVARFCNERTVRQARRFVWADSAAQEKFIERHLGVEPSMSFNQVALAAARKAAAV